MEWRELSSSAIARAAYEETSRTMTVEFCSGTVYEYFDVPQKVYQGLVEAESVGHYFAENIRDVYRFTRTSPPEAVE